jgi:predicted Zn finger-like uncharacterized protein
MIIKCINCGKKFEIDSDLIPKNGRLVQCGSCNHKWHYVNELSENVSIETKVNPIPDEKIEQNFEKKSIKTNVINKDLTEKVVNDNYLGKTKNNTKKIHFLNIILVFLITFIALLVLIDTFQPQLISLIPEIEFILYNFYETINDVTLFLKDLF